jgi:hypothetical protein
LIRLNERSFELLKRCLEAHNPYLIPLIEAKDYDNYSVNMYNELRVIVGNELCEKGFNKDWEPTEYGWELENLIDEIGRLFM